MATRLGHFLQIMDVTDISIYCLKCRNKQDVIFSCLPLKNTYAMTMFFSIAVSKWLKSKSHPFAFVIYLTKNSLDVIISMAKYFVQKLTFCEVCKASNLKSLSVNYWKLFKQSSLHWTKSFVLCCILNS